MNHPDERPCADSHQPFVKADAYATPETPAEHIIRRTISKARRLLGQECDADGIRVDQLQRPADDWRDRIAPSTASARLSQELHAHLDGRLDVAASEQRVQVLLWPPGDPDDLLRQWAEQHGYHLLQAPARHELIQGLAFDATVLHADTPVVITDVAHWFLRHRTGLETGRSMLRHLASIDAPCIIACNSWAWPWLSKVAAIDLLLPEPMTFAPFDATRLATWFKRATETEGLQFYASRSGDDVLLTDADGEPESTYLRELAALSLGIPWVACQLWRDGMRKEQETEEETEKEKEKEKEKEVDENTVWMVPPVDHPLPSGREHDARLIMHAILLHGGLHPDELALTLPGIRTQALVTGLLHSGALVRRGDSLECAHRVYPDVREALISAGFPTGIF